MKQLWVKAALLWVFFGGLAVLNGVFRESVLLPWLGARAALSLSGLLLSAAILISTWTALPWLGRLRPAACGGLGAAWVLLTVVLEFGAGRAAGKSWSVLLAAFDPRGGNLWVLVLLALLCAPALAVRLRKPAGR